MALVKLKPTSAGRRHAVKVVNKELHKGKPWASLTEKKNRGSGRNNNGHITCRHKGGGHKRAYRIIDFKRLKDGVPARVERIDTTRTVPLTSLWSSIRTANVAISSLRRVLKWVRKS